MNTPNDAIICCFGDSNTWGYDPRGYLGGQYDHPWPEILADKLRCTVINQGENGREIPLYPVEFPGQSDLLIVMLGTNDLLQGATAEEASARMERFMRTMDPRKVLLIAPPPMKPGQWVADRQLLEESKGLAARYRALAARLGVRFADAGQWNLPLAYDGVHLTEEAHGIFARELGKILTAP